MEQPPHCFQMSLKAYMKSKGPFFTITCDVRSACGIYPYGTLLVAVQKEIGGRQNFNHRTIKNKFIVVQSIRAFLQDDNWGPPDRDDEPSAALWQPLEPPVSNITTSAHPSQRRRHNGSTPTNMGGGMITSDVGSVTSAISTLGSSSARAASWSHLSDNARLKSLL